MFAHSPRLRLYLSYVADAYMDVDTTADREEGGTQGGAGSILNTVVPGQTPEDAGRTRPNPSTGADRLPGELPSDVQRATQESTVSNLLNEKSAVGLFSGCVVRITERGTQKVVERHARVTRVHDGVVTVQGGESYDQTKYDFLRLS